MKMILLHDLAESEIGDYTPGQIATDKKNELENIAFLKILNTLPDSLKTQYGEIWTEFQENKTPESQMVHQIDKLEMALQAKAYEKQGHSKDKLKTFIESAQNEITYPELKELFTKIIEDD